MTSKSYKTFLYFSLFTAVALLSVLTVFNSCKSKPSEAFQLTGDTIADGKKLMQMHCTGCHEQTDIGLLPKDVWIYHTLPSMAPYLGISTYGIDYFKKDTVSKGVSLAEWQTIVAYCRKMAPAALPAAKHPDTLLNDWAGFALKTPKPLSNEMSFTTLVAVNPNNHKIYTSDEKTKKLSEWTTDLKGREIADLPSSAVNAAFSKDTNGANLGVFSCIGELMPMDFPNGKVLQLNLDTKTDKKQQIIASELTRPVQSIEGDFNHDGLKDWLVAGEGNKSGHVYLLKQNQDHTYAETKVVDQAGAVQMVTGDFNKDGWLDFMVLYGSSNEGLWMYLNDHKGSFTSKALLKFPPVYGSTSFQLSDFDHDGLPDLIYSCGYNYRDSRILKPYHGLYIFKNLGNWKFKQTWFYPINGCTKAIAADFDGDGDLDIATSAFFADLKGRPAEGCIYFEQDKPLHFVPHALPVNKYGRWMGMEVADYNQDGKPDILLGNFARGLNIQDIPNPFWNTQLPFIVLQNNFKKQAIYSVF